MSKMSILRKRKKPKLRFRNMSRRVTNREFNYLKKLCLECLRENEDIEKQLDSYYQHIQIFFFYESTEQNIVESIRAFLNYSTLNVPSHPRPATTVSIKGFGCIVFFLKHLKEFTAKRNDVPDIEAYHKNGVFEELCHLVEQKGDCALHPESYWILWNCYRQANNLLIGNEIIVRLDTDRNHYEVYLMMINACPNQWVDRYWKYFMNEAPDYEKMKLSVPIEIVHARLLTDTLRSINVLHVAKKVKKEKLSLKQKELLKNLIDTGKRTVDRNKKLINKELGSNALLLINSLDENIFKTPDAFFPVILDLWETLNLV